MRDRQAIWEFATLRLHTLMQRVGVAVWHPEDTDETAVRKLMAVCDHVEAVLEEHVSEKPKEAKVLRLDGSPAIDRIAQVMRAHGVPPPEVGEPVALAWLRVAAFVEELDARLDGPPRPPRDAA